MGNLLYLAEQIGNPLPGPSSSQNRSSLFSISSIDQNTLDYSVSSNIENPEVFPEHQRRRVSDPFPNPQDGPWYHPSPDIPSDSPDPAMIPRATQEMTRPDGWVTLRELFSSQPNPPDPTAYPGPLGHVLGHILDTVGFQRESEEMTIPSEHRGQFDPLPYPPIYPDLANGNLEGREAPGASARNSQLLPGPQRPLLARRNAVAQVPALSNLYNATTLQQQEQIILQEQPRPQSQPGSQPRSQTESMISVQPSDPSISTNPFEDFLQRIGQPDLRIALTPAPQPALTDAREAIRRARRGAEAMFDRRRRGAFFRSPGNPNSNPNPASASPLPTSGTRSRQPSYAALSQAHRQSGAARAGQIRSDEAMEFEFDGMPRRLEILSPTHSSERHSANSLNLTDTLPNFHASLDTRLRQPSYAALL